MASLEKPLGKTKETEETVGKMRKLQEGSPGKTVEHRGKDIEKNKDLKLNGVRPPLGFGARRFARGWGVMPRKVFHTPSFTQSFTHHFVSHTTLSHRIFHTQLCHTGSFTPLCHTPSFTHRHRPSLTYHLSHHFVTHHLSHTVTDHLSHTIFHTLAQKYLISFMWKGCGQSLEATGRMLAQLQATDPCSTENGDPTNRGQLFNQTTSTGWEAKNGQQFTLLRRITNSKV